MKRILLLVAVALAGAGSVCAALTEADLAPGAVNRAIAAKPAAERQAFAREVLGAVAAQPIDDAAKTQALVRASRALIEGAGPQTVNVIAEVFNSVPVAQLPGVADLLANNFDQKAHGLTAEAYDRLASSIVKSASQYIEASGTDSPAVRIGILAATFSKASEDPARTRPLVIAALPAAVQAAATAYVGAAEQGNREMIAAAAGVDAVEPTPADPDAASVVAPAAAAAASTASATPAADPAVVASPGAEADYLRPQPPAGMADTAAGEGGKETAEVKVPLLFRFASDNLGLTFDAMRAASYDWALVDDPVSVPRDPVVPTLPGFGNLAEVGTLDQPFAVGQSPRPPVRLPAPSPSYGNQYVR